MELSEPKLDMSGRKKASDLLEWVIEEPETAAHRLVALEVENETLKKATDALSAERASKMADEMETGRRISTTRHIRELRVYVDILERKNDQEEKAD